MKNSKTKWKYSRQNISSNEQMKVKKSGKLSNGFFPPKSITKYLEKSYNNMSECASFI